MFSHLVKRLTFSAIIASALAAPAHAADLVAGPMLGQVTANSARVWFQFSEAGQLSITTYDAATNRQISGIRVDIKGPPPFVGDIPVDDLEPDSTYRIDVKFDGKPVKIPPFVIPTMPVKGQQVAFSIAFGGNVMLPAADANFDPAAQKIPALRAAAQTRPRAFLFLGNNGMLPAKLEQFPTTHRAAFRMISDFHAAIRRIPDVESIVTTTPSYAIFSERDFGPLGSNADYVFAQESLVAFERFWPNPDWGTPENPGCFTTFSIGDVDFFLLDTRMFRSVPPAATAPALQPASSQAAPALLGAAQMDWLEKNLLASHARFKVLAAPCPLWDDNVTGDSWAAFPEERRDFLAWLMQNKIAGIVSVASGADGQITKNQPEKFPYPLYTVASSSLLSAPAKAGAAGRQKIADTFGTLDFGGENEHRFLTARIHDDAGKTKAEYTVLAAQLRAP